MVRRMTPFAGLLLLCCSACPACARSPEITDPAVAANDPDFKIQGEYLGEGHWEGNAPQKVGAQVIALGHGRFTVVVTKGGLPGDGWKRGEPRFSLDGNRIGDTTALSGDHWAGKIADDGMTIVGQSGETKLDLKRMVRHSPTEGAKPPAGALVLFDGTTAENFIPGVLLPDGNLLSEETTKRGFGDYTLHLEFRLSYMPEARGQARSNSGVYLHDCYEIQVLDSFGLEGEDNECGGFYQLRRPDVNMCLPPLDVADLRRRFHRAEVSGRQEGRRRPGRSAPQRRGDPSGVCATARHARPPAGRPRAAAALSPGPRQQGRVSQYLAEGEEVIARKKQGDFSTNSLRACLTARYTQIRFALDIKSAFIPRPRFTEAALWFRYVCALHDPPKTSLSKRRLPAGFSIRFSEL